MIGIEKQEIHMRITPQPWDIDTLEERELEQKKYEEDRNRWNKAVDIIEGE